MVIMTEQLHTPVMLNEALAYLNPQPGKVIIDATVGMGGHAFEIARRIAPTGKLIAIDRDRESLELAQERLKDYHGIVEFVYGNFSDIQEIAGRLNITSVDGIILDLGLSMFQLMQAERGFSFNREGRLTCGLTATATSRRMTLLIISTKKKYQTSYGHLGRRGGTTGLRAG